MNNYFIYQRVSTEKQTVERQESAIGEYCKENNIIVPTENIYSDVITGKTIKRKNYQAMKERITKGDVLILLDLDRLGRSWDIIKEEWTDLTERIGAYIVIVNCPMINALPDKNGTISTDRRLIQTVMFELLCYMSQREVEKISQRTKEGLQAKREQGIKLGRPTTYTKEDNDKILELAAKGLSQRAIAKELNVSLGKVNATLKKGVA